MSEVLTLVFTRDNPSNTTLVDSESGKVVYTVVTEHPKETITKIKNADGQTIASWVWHDTRSDVITLGTTKPFPISSWLKKSLIPFKHTVTMQATGGKEYKWKGDGTGMSLALFCSEDKENAIVRFQKSRRKPNRSTTPPTFDVTPARLLLNSRGQEIQDLAVISFLALEKTRRTNETSQLNMSDTMGTPMSFIGGAS